MLGRRFEGEDGEVGGRPGTLCWPRFRIWERAAIELGRCRSAVDYLHQAANSPCRFYDKILIGLANQDEGIENISIARTVGRLIRIIDAEILKVGGERSSTFRACSASRTSAHFAGSSRPGCELRRFPYEVVDAPDPRKAPKGTLPFIEDAGRAHRRSSLIVDHLVAVWRIDPN